MDKGPAIAYLHPRDWPGPAAPSPRAKGCGPNGSEVPHRLDAGRHPRRPTPSPHSLASLASLASPTRSLRSHRSLRSLCSLRSLRLPLVPNLHRRRTNSNHVLRSQTKSTGVKPPQTKPASLAPHPYTTIHHRRSCGKDVTVNGLRCEGWDQRG